MKPTIALVGRPNVGKSTLFNRLTRSRDAIVANLPGLTRDRHYGVGRLGKRPYLALDTGGFEPLVNDGILSAMARQTLQAIDEADAVVFLVDARQGVTPHDKEIAARLRRQRQPVLVAVNKAEGLDRGVAVAQFYELGLGQPYAISAAHGDGVRNFVDLVLSRLPADDEDADDDAVAGDKGEGEGEGEDQDVAAASPENSANPEQAVAVSAAAHQTASDTLPQSIKVAIVGRPNVGKSTLINTLLGEERVIAFDQPGTTRDAIEIEFQRGKQSYVLVDTAGMRKRGKVFQTVEKFSVIKTLQAIEAADVVVLMVDAQADVSDQDAHIADFIVQSGRALVVAVNKWDGLDGYQRDQIKVTLLRKLKFLDFANFHFISAQQGKGLGNLWRSVNAAYLAAGMKLATPQLTRVLGDAVARQAPPRHGLFRPKPRYAHQGGSHPPVIVIHGNALEHLPASYTRYLENTFREVFRLQGTPLVIQYVSGKNPYADKEG